MRIFGKGKHPSTVVESSDIPESARAGTGETKKSGTKAGRQVKKLVSQIRLAIWPSAKAPADGSSADYRNVSLSTPLIAREPTSPVPDDQQSQLKTLSHEMSAAQNLSLCADDFVEPIEVERSLTSTLVSPSSVVPAVVVGGPERELSGADSDVEDTTFTTFDSDEASEAADVSQVSDNENPEDVADFDVNALFQGYRLPEVGDVKRNPAERMVGWFAEKLLKKHLPVDTAILDERRRNLTELQVQLKANRQTRESLEKEGKNLDQRFKKDQNMIEKLQRSLNELAKRIDTLEKKLDSKPESHQTMTSLTLLRKQELKEKEQLNPLLKTQQETQVHLDAANNQLSALERNEASLIHQTQEAETALKEAEARQVGFNRQIVSFVLNLRRIYQGKAALSSVSLPHLKIPMGDEHLDLHNVSFRPVSIETRTDERGRPLVDVTLKDIQAAMDVPVEAGVLTDVDASIDGIKLTLGGPVAKAFVKYLHGPKTAVGINMGNLVSEILTAIRDEKPHPPAQVKAEVGNVALHSNRTNAEKIAKFVAKGRRTPGSGLDQLLAGLRVPVSVNVKELNVCTGNDIDKDDPALEHGEAMKLNARLQDLEVNLSPDVNTKLKSGQRQARLAVCAGHAHVDLDSPVGLALGAMEHLQPSDPLGSQLQPSALSDSRRGLDAPPSALSQTASVDLSDINAVFDRNVKKRTTAASPYKPVWTVEGTGTTNVQIEKVTVSSAGDAKGTGVIHKLHVHAGAENGQDKIHVSVAANDENGQSTGQIGLSAESGWIRSLAKLAGSDGLQQWVVEGAGDLALNGNVAVAIDPDSKAQEVTVDGVQLDIREAIHIRKGDVGVSLPRSIHGEIKDLTVKSSPIQEYQGSKIKRTEFGIGELSVQGQGDVIIHTKAQDDGASAQSKIIPVKGHQNTLSDVRLEKIQMLSADGKEGRQRLIVHPGKLIMEDVSIKGVDVTKVRMNLRDDLDGIIWLDDANISMNKLLFEGENPPKLKARWRRLLKNKRLTLDGTLGMKKGCINPRDISASKVKLMPIEGHASRFNRFTCAVVNRLLNSALNMASSEVVQFDHSDQRLVFNLPLLRKLPIPIPQSVMDLVVVNEKGHVNLGATQFRASGIYCLPASRQKHLDDMLKQVLVHEQSVHPLDALITEIETSIQHPETVQEALYLLNGLPIERLTVLAKENESIRAALHRIVDLAMTPPHSYSIALEIFNHGLSLGLEPSPDQLKHLLEAIQPDNDNACDLAQLLCNLSRTGQARPMLEKIVEHNPSNLRAQTMLADMEWSLGQHEQAVGRISQVAHMTKDPEAISPLVELLGSWTKGSVNPNSEQVLKARLLSASLLLRSEIVGGRGDMFLRGIQTLEALAQLEDQPAIAEAAIAKLKQRCGDSARIAQKLDLEPWTVWRKKVNEVVETLKQGKRPRLRKQDHYPIALSLMYGHKGIDQNLLYARQLFQLMEPMPKHAAVQLAILESMLIRGDVDSESGSRAQLDRAV